jgi:hypothetical protein
VVGRHLPQAFGPNREFHREFWPWIPSEVHEEHLRRSQQFLIDYFRGSVETFIPPGNVWTEQTEKAAVENGIRYLSSRESLAPTGTTRNGILFVGDGQVLAFHDMEIVLFGVGWLEALLETHRAFRLVTVKELGDSLREKLCSLESA